jgi:hypothetical protein
MYYRDSTRVGTDTGAIRGIWCRRNRGWCSQLECRGSTEFGVEEVEVSVANWNVDGSFEAHRE